MDEPQEFLYEEVGLLYERVMEEVAKRIFSIKLELNEQIRIFSVTGKNLQEKMSQKKKRSGGG